ncbi:YueI family protein [Cytobacillus sp. FSL K6-0129]|uniref:YueI family protein n=1 Tax=Cytobacillus sp. FSL K6-0129 TaxID=2921421 RepID=UPI0030F5E01D
MAEKVDDYITQGIYGKKETKPDERRKFLGTLRERTVIALTQAQVRKPGIMKEVKEAMTKNKQARVYLNGHIAYRDISKYAKLASEQHMSFTIVTNKDYNSDLGLVLAYDYAIDQDDIYVQEQTKVYKEANQTEAGFKQWMKKIFRK